MSTSPIDPTIPPLSPSLLPPKTENETPQTQTVIDSLGMIKHIEGGYFAEIDRNPLNIPNPFLGRESGIPTPPNDEEGRTAVLPISGDDSIRNASTSIYYLLTPKTPIGHFHRKKGRTVHTLISGRGRYVLIHADEEDVERGSGGGVRSKGKRIETFAVGHNLAAGEKCVWVVEGGKFKASFLTSEEPLLISETVIPGFEYSDHDFMTQDVFSKLVPAGKRDELQWLVRKGDKPEESELK